MKMFKKQNAFFNTSEKYGSSSKQSFQIISYLVYSESRNLWEINCGNWYGIFLFIWSIKFTFLNKYLFVIA